MIKFLQASEIQGTSVLRDMYRLRTKVFHERLGWNVKIKNGLEIDEYDDCNPIYVAKLADDGRKVLGCLRFLPTTGPTMLKGPLGNLFPEPVDLEGPNMWECTRFAVADECEDYGRQSVRKVTAELIMAGCVLGLRTGMTDIIGVFDQTMKPIYRRLGWEPLVLASSTPTTSKLPVHVGIWSVDEQVIDRLAALHGFYPNIASDAFDGSLRIDDPEELMAA